MKRRSSVLNHAERENVHNYHEFMKPGHTATWEDVIGVQMPLQAVDRSVVDELEMDRPDASMRGRLYGAEHILGYLMAGNATFTLVSTKTGARFTYKIRQPKEDSPHFVSLLNGPDNTEDYQFLGTIFADKTYRHGRKSSVSETASSAVAISYFLRFLLQGRVSDLVEVWHEGKCGRCGRKLTVPASIERGLGPDCAGM